MPKIPGGILGDGVKVQAAMNRNATVLREMELSEFRKKDSNNALISWSGYVHSVGLHRVQVACNLAFPNDAVWRISKNYLMAVL